MINEQARILVTGATGMQGRPIVNALLARDGRDKQTLEAVAATVLGTWPEV